MAYILYIILSILYQQSAFATPHTQLQSIIQEALSTSPEVKAAEEQVMEDLYKYKATKAESYPNISLDYTSGAESIKTPTTPATKSQIHTYTVELTQPLYHFGTQRSKNTSMKIAVAKSKQQLIQTKTQTLRQIIDTYINLIKEKNNLISTIETIDYIKKQKSIEEKAEKIGGSDQTEILPLKTQLINAEIKLKQHESQIASTLSRYLYLVGHLPQNIKQLPLPAYPSQHLPKTRQEAIKTAIKNNQGYKI